MKIVNDVTIGSMFAESVNRYPKRPALKYEKRVWTYEQLDEITDKIALGMLHIGIRKGTKTGIWANERPNTLFCFLALEKIGAVPVMLNTSWRSNEMATCFRAVDAEYLIYDEGYRDLDFVEICGKARIFGLKQKIYIGETENSHVGEWDVVMTLEELLAGAAQLKESVLQEAKASVADSDVDMILFTSGSTSRPKGVVTTHFSRVNNVRAQAEMVNATENDVFCVAIPMFHCFSMSGNILAALLVGAAICFPKSRKTDHILGAVESAGCTVLTAVPTLYSALLANERKHLYDISTLRTGLVGGAGCSAELFERACEEFGLELLPSLGQTEATAGITVGSYEESPTERAETTGYLLEHIEAKVIDIKTGEICADGVSGELCIRGYNVMKEYYGQPELTRETIDEDGFLHTGDMGFFDEKGRLHLTGRCKELIIRGGENIAPGEVEDVIRKDKRVAQVKVIGVPDEHYGEEVCACVECVPNEPVSEEEIKALVKENLAAYKVPKYVVFYEKIPLTGSGKIDTLLLKEGIKKVL